MRHGDNYSYIKCKCRCPECRAWWAAYWENYLRRRFARTGEAYSGSKGGFVPGKPCACGCGLGLPATSPNRYKRGHMPSASQDRAA